MAESNALPHAKNRDPGRGRTSIGRRSWRRSRLARHGVVVYLVLAGHRSRIREVIHPVGGYSGIAMRTGAYQTCDLVTRVPWGNWVTLDCYVDNGDTINGNSSGATCGTATGARSTPAGSATTTCPTAAARRVADKQGPRRHRSARLVNRRGGRAQAPNSRTTWRWRRQHKAKLSHYKRRGHVLT